MRDCRTLPFQGQFCRPGCLFGHSGHDCGHECGAVIGHRPPNPRLHAPIQSHSHRAEQLQDFEGALEAAEQALQRRPGDAKATLAREAAVEHVGEVRQEGAYSPPRRDRMRTPSGGINAVEAAAGVGRRAVRPSVRRQGGRAGGRSGLRAVGRVCGGSSGLAGDLSVGRAVGRSVM